MRLSFCQYFIKRSSGLLSMEILFTHELYKTVKDVSSDWTQDLVLYTAFSMQGLYLLELFTRLSDRQEKFNINV